MWKEFVVAMVYIGYRTNFVEARSIINLHGRAKLGVGSILVEQGERW